MPSPDDPSGAFDPGLPTTPVAQARPAPTGTADRQGAVPLPAPHPAAPGAEHPACARGGGHHLRPVRRGLRARAAERQPEPALARPSRITTAKGAVLQAVPARPLLKAIVSDGQPPDDLLNVLAVPSGAAPVPGSTINQGVEQYDRSIRFEVAASPADVIAFFRAQLPAQHWKRLSQGPSSTATGYQILEQRPASDGLEWEIGVTVAPTAFSTPGVTPASGSSTTPRRRCRRDDARPGRRLQHHRVHGAAVRPVRPGLTRPPRRARHGLPRRPRRLPSPPTHRRRGPGVGSAPSAPTSAGARSWAATADPWGGSTVSSPRSSHAHTKRSMG